MAQQIRMEAALAAFRKKCGDLLDANVLLEAQIAELEQENERLRPHGQAEMPEGPPPAEPGLGGLSG